MTIQEDLTELKKDFKHFKSNDFEHLKNDVITLKNRLSWSAIITSALIILAALLG